jgi:hypothetical protein
MTTTALFVEILVGGVQSLIWLGLLFLIWCDPKNLLAWFKDGSLGSSVILLLLSYSIGVVFDRMWDLVIKPIDRRIRAHFLPETGRVHQIRILLFSKDETRAYFVEYIRSRMRISRATVCNSIMMVIASVIVYIIYRKESWSSWLVCLALFSFLMAIAAIYAYVNITTNYYKTLQQIEPYLVKKE